MLKKLFHLKKMKGLPSLMVFTLVGLPDRFPGTIHLINNNIIVG